LLGVLNKQQRDSVKITVAVSSEGGNGLSGVIKGKEYLEWLKNQLLFIKGSASWSSLMRLHLTVKEGNSFGYIFSVIIGNFFTPPYDK
jgi:hypothetical protein